MSFFAFLTLTKFTVDWSKLTPVVTQG